jgi:hypothetical protein
MSDRPPAVRPLPHWLIVAGSALIVFHFSALIVLVLAAPSGPWPTEFGSSTALPPTFAQNINDSTTPGYLQPLKMTHNYHFESNRTDRPHVFFEVRLLDEEGNPLKTLRFPDPEANRWVRHRQQLLASWLGNDQPVPYPQGEVLAPPGQELPTREVWDYVDEQGTLGLRRVNDIQLRKVFDDRGPGGGVMAPSQLSRVMAGSYVRHLCRQHGAASGVLLRHSKNVIPPALMFVPEPELARFTGEGRYETLVSNFGEFSR